MMDNEQLPKGYKVTEVGIIPEDWEVYILGDLLLRIADVDHYMPKTEKYGIPYLMTGDIKDYASEIDFDNCKKISKDDFEKLSKKIRTLKSDIILARYATVGSVSYVDIDEEFVVSYSCVTIKPDKSKLNDVFLFHYFKSNIFGLEVKNKVNANIQDNVGIGDLMKMKIPLPPTKSEQTAIATALSDADALINSLEKLIAKKRNIKQGAMQQLLKPKEGWEVKKLGEVAEIYQPQTISQDVFIDDGYLVYGANGIVGKYHLYNHETWQTTITCRGSTCGTVNRTVGKSWITGNAMVMNVDKNTNIDKLFFYYILTKQDFSQCITGSGQPQIVRNPLFEFKVSIPKTNEEQTRIATILSDMDNEINALETKLEKYRKIKLGMMQVLLTGKVRLV
ncbi:MAG TPA: restriction endonuclease subunit S [Bacteroidales bacterium]|nr:restriction endonuclease subunit S [Bacteroidales bacterium]